MPTRTTIEWCDFTSNPIRAYNRTTGMRGWHCIKTSPGCAHCYAESLNKRFGTGDTYTTKAAEDVGLHVQESELKQLLAMNPRGPFKSGARPIVFLQDMGDLFDSRVSFDVIDEILCIVMMRPDIDFCMLTKQVKRMAEYFASLAFDEESGQIQGEDGGYRLGTAAGRFLDGPWIHGHGRRHRRRIEQFIADTHDVDVDDDAACAMRMPVAWPPKNLRLGISVSTQPDVDRGVSELLHIPAALHYLSIEPLLGPIVLPQLDDDGGDIDDAYERALWGLPESVISTPEAPPGAHIAWVIVGGESGASGRPMDPDWVRPLLQQCRVTQTPFFFKQWGKWAPLGGVMVLVGEKPSAPELDGRVWREFPEVSA